MCPSAYCDGYLERVEHGAGLLQRHGGPGLQGLGRVGDLHQPPAQLLHHLSVALPLANQTVDDAPPLLSSPHDALPLVTQQSQFQVELVPAGAGKSGNAINGWIEGGSSIQYESVLPVIHLTLLQHLLSIANNRVQDLLPAEHLRLE